MKHYLRICAEINLNAVAYNFKSMKDPLAPETKMIAVVKTDGYGHGAPPSVPLLDKPKSFPKQYGVYPSFLRCGPDCPGELSSVMCSMIELPCTVFHKEAH